MYFNEITSARFKYVITKENWKLICELNKLLKKYNKLYFEYFNLLIIWEKSISLNFFFYFSII